MAIRVEGCVLSASLDDGVVTRWRLIRWKRRLSLIVVDVLLDFRIAGFSGEPVIVVGAL